MTSVSPGDAAAAAGFAGQQGFAAGTAEFFLQNYRLGKTLGIGSFGKVRSSAGRRPPRPPSCRRRRRSTAQPTPRPEPLARCLPCLPRCR